MCKKVGALKKVKDFGYIYIYIDDNNEFEFKLDLLER